MYHLLAFIWPKLNKRTKGKWTSKAQVKRPSRWVTYLTIYFPNLAKKVGHITSLLKWYRSSLFLHFKLAKFSDSLSFFLGLSWLQQEALKHLRFLSIVPLSSKSLKESLNSWSTSLEDKFPESKVRLHPIFSLFKYMIGVENFVYIYQEFMDCDKS